MLVITGDRGVSNGLITHVYHAWHKILALCTSKTSLPGTQTAMKEFGNTVSICSLQVDNGLTNEGVASGAIPYHDAAHYLQLR